MAEVPVRREIFVTSLITVYMPIIESKVSAPVYRGTSGGSRDCGGCGVPMNWVGYVRWTVLTKRSIIRLGCR